MSISTYPQALFLKKKSVHVQDYGVGFARFKICIIHQKEVLIHSGLPLLPLCQTGIVQPFREEVAKRQIENMLFLEMITFHPFQTEVVFGGDSYDTLFPFYFRGNREVILFRNFL